MSRRGQRAAWGIFAIVLLLPGALALVARGLSSSSPAARARTAYDRGEWERAAEVLRPELKSGPGRSVDPELFRIYARAQIRMGRDEAGAAIYEGRLASIKLEPEDAFLKGLAMVRTGRPEAAWDTWEHAIKDGADHPEMLDHFTRLSFRLQRMDQALDAARWLSKQAGWEARGLFLLAEVDELIDDPPGVVAALEPALGREPGARGALFDAAHYRKLLARNLLRLGRPAEAESQLKAIRPQAAGASSTVEDREAEWLLSRAYLQQKRMPEAAKALDRAGSYGAEHPLAPEPAAYVGSAACQPCHPDESRKYDATRHTRSFYHGKGLAGLPVTDRPVPDPDDPKVMHTIERKGGEIEARSKIDDRVTRMVVEYAFGTPQHYLTMIARDEDKGYRALRVSYYHTPAGSGWGATAGDVGHSSSMEDRRGQRIDVRDGVVRCLHCHVTRSRDFRDPPPEGGAGPEAVDRGIGCERCHGPGGNHIKAIENDLADGRGYGDFAIINVAGATAATANGQCAECHTVGLPSVISRAPEDPAYVRSPGVTMTFSRCYTESNGALSCMTCHDPHREADHTAAPYEAKCLSCHSATPAKPAALAAAAAGRRTVCPVNPARDCLGCHMPKVPMPTLHANLTDHYIRVRRQDKDEVQR